MNVTCKYPRYTNIQTYLQFGMVIFPKSMNEILFMFQFKTRKNSNNFSVTCVNSKVLL